MSKPDITLEGAKAEKCRRSFYYFVQEFWDTIIPEKPHWNWHIKYLCDQVQEIWERLKRREPKLYDFYIINVPPGESKTTIITIMATVWGWIIDPTLRFICSTYSETLSEQSAKKVQTIIEHNRFQLYFPDLEFSGGISDLRTRENGQRYITATKGTVTGVHAHAKLVDDPINVLLAASDVEREKANTFVSESLSTRNVDDALTVTLIIMQRLHENDTTGYLLEKAKEGLKIHHICLPAELTSDVRPKSLAQYYVDGLMNPFRKPLPVLIKKKLELGSYGYAGQMLQSPAPAKGAVWGKWFVGIPDSVFPSKTSFTAYGTDWDLAYTKNDENAASAYITSGRINHKMFIDDLGWVYMEFPELIKFMRTLSRPHYIEAKGPGKSAKSTLTKNGIPAIEIEVPGGSDKMNRARQAAPYPEAGMVCIRQSLLDRLYFDAEQGILKFPRGKKQDLADVLAQAIQRIFKGSIISANGGSSDSVLDGITPA